MKDFQIEFRQMVHRFSPDHPVVTLALFVLLAGATIGFSSRWFQKPLETLSISAELAAIDDVRQTLDQLENQINATGPLSDIPMVFGRKIIVLPEVAQPKPVVAPPGIEQVVEIPAMHLSAVFRSSAQPLAEINGRLYGVGEIVEGMCKVQAIHPERVVLEADDGRIITLVLYEGVDHAP